MAKAPRIPKSKCCVSKPKCKRCPLRMLRDGTLPSGYAVKRRRLVRIDGGKVSKKHLKKLARSKAGT
ncbi:MAG: hypothetical protein L0G22_11890 [Propionibacteriaceae bacterium]|nr:hypothetical protein [Propionibacteriaceae bacterium]